MGIAPGIRSHVAVINVWATWCEPCVEETPDLVAFHKGYASRGVKFISLSLDFPDELDSRVLPFVREHKVGFPVHVLDGVPPEEVMAAFGLEATGWDGALPATFLLDGAGQVRKTWLGPVGRNDLTRAADRLL